MPRKNPNRSNPNVDNNFAMRARKEGAINKALQIRRIYERDKGICQICKLPCSWEDASRDHIKALAICTVEEARSDSNIQLAHRLCNNNKSNPKGKQSNPNGKQSSPKETGLTIQIGTLFPELDKIFPHEAN